jgi:rare lipoprotein A
MRRRFAEGLAVVLSIASLGAGAASRPSGLEAAKVTKAQVMASSNEPARKFHKKSQAYQVGTASWYGEQFQGKQTASGEPYDMREFTAAHPSLPLGTFVRVTNLKNGSSVVVRINDRGPVVDGRIIDVSYNAAQALGFRARGVQRVRLDLYQPATMARLEPVANLK